MVFSHSAWASQPRPRGTAPTSSAQAGTGSAATAAADDLQLALSPVCTLQELLNELLQPQLGTGLPGCRLFQELVDLHHLLLLAAQLLFLMHQVLLERSQQFHAHVHLARELRRALLQFLLLTPQARALLSCSLQLCCLALQFSL